VFDDTEVTLAMDGINSIENKDFFWPGIIPTRCAGYPPKGIKKMDSKPLHLRVHNLIQELGAPRVARELNVSEGRVYKYGEDPEESGADIPVRQLRKLFELASADVSRERVQTPVDELVGYFAEPARRRLVRAADLDDLQYVVGKLQGVTGGPLKRLAVIACPDCGDELCRSAEISGQPVFVCRSCGGNKKN
jgi:hypothetical protein